MAEHKVGEVSHWYGELEVAGINLTEDVKVGDTLHFAGHTTDFTQKVDSIQIEHDQVAEAHQGDAIGIKVGDRVRVHDDVYMVE